MDQGLLGLFVQRGMRAQAILVFPPCLDRRWISR